jgi:hypothetical protein
VIESAYEPRGLGIDFFRLAAHRATVCETGLIRLQFKLLMTDDANFDGK